jgi:hypothetical protein
MRLSPEQVEALLYELCVRLGFCLKPEHDDRFRASHPTDAREFAREVFVAEGMNPETARPELMRAVVTSIERAFAAAASSTPPGAC